MKRIGVLFLLACAACFAAGYQCGVMRQQLRTTAKLVAICNLAVENLEIPGQEARAEMLLYLCEEMRKDIP